MYLFIRHDQSMQYSSTNTPHQFSVWLHQPLNLRTQQWECAITEYSVQSIPTLHGDFLINTNFTDVSNVFGSSQPTLRHFNIQPAVDSTSLQYHQCMPAVPYYMPVLNGTTQQLHFSIQPVQSHIAPKTYINSTHESGIRAFSCVLHFRLV